MSYVGAGARPLVRARNQLAQHLRNVRPRVAEVEVPSGGIISEVPRTMAFRRSRRTLKRRFKRRKRGIIRRRVPVMPIPRSKVLRMKAVYAVQVSHPSGAMAGMSISMNDITDPFGANTNVQPLYTDALRALWSKAVVLGSLVRFRVHNGGAVAVLTGVTPLPESQGATGLSECEHYMELPGNRSVLLSPDVDNRIITNRVGIARHFGVRKLRDEDSLHVDFDGEVAPTRQAYWRIWSRPIDKTTAVTVDYVIELEYIVLLYDRIIAARSTDT